MTNTKEVAPKKRLKTLLETPLKPKPMPTHAPDVPKAPEAVLEVLEDGEKLISLSHDRHGNAIALSDKNRLYVFVGNDAWERMR
jgi:hypothetical protein